MKFYSEAQRKRHPQAGLIPLCHWVACDLFDQSQYGGMMPDVIIQLMQAKEEDIIGQIKEALKEKNLLIQATVLPDRGKYGYVSLYNENERFCPRYALDSLNQKKGAWLAIALSHRSLKPEALVRIGQALKMKDEDLCDIALRIGRIDVLRDLEKKSPARFQSMINERGYALFDKALMVGQVSSCAYLEDKLGLAWVQKNLEGTDILEFFRGHHFLNSPEIFRYFEEKSPEEFKKLVQECAESLDSKGVSDLFSMIARNGSIEVLRYFSEKEPERWAAFLKKADNEVFYFAIEKGRPDVLTYLEEQVRKDRFQMLFKEASGFYKLHPSIKLDLEGTLNSSYSWSTYPTEQASLLLAIKDQTGPKIIFDRVVAEGHLELVRYLEQKDRTLLPSHERMFELIAHHGHYNIFLPYLEEKMMPEAFLKQLCDYAEDAFRIAIKTGDLVLFRYLEEKVPSLLPTWINDLPVGGDPTFMDYFIEKPGIFYGVEPKAHQPEYAAIALSFLAKKIASLRRHKATLESSSTTIIFDVQEASETQLLFEMVRFLIRLNDLEYRDDLVFLLNIPSVRALAHTDENALYQLAVTRKNRPAIGLLLAIPAVSEKDKEHPFEVKEELPEKPAQTWGKLSAYEQAQKNHYDATQAAIKPPMVKVLSESDNMVLGDAIKKLKQITLDYQKSVGSSKKENNRIAPILEQLMAILQKTDNSKEQQLKEYYDYLGALSKNDSTQTNMDLIQQDKSRFSISFRDGVIMVATLLTGILPGLLVLGLILAITKQSSLDCFKSRAHQFKKDSATIRGRVASFFPEVSSSESTIVSEDSLGKDVIDPTAKSS
jgi:hypothetical protein